MTDGGQDRSQATFSTPVPVPGAPLPVKVPTTVEFDNVYTSHTPESLTDGVKTEVDASSLDSAASWLDEYANWLYRTSYDLGDVKELMGEVGMGGGAAARRPLGSFPWALELAKKHSSLTTTTESALRQLSTQLHEAADALRKIKENYHSAEGANKMSAQDMQQVFADVARNEG